MIPKFKDTYILTEIKDSTGNINAMIDAYGLADHAPDRVATDRAGELMSLWRKYSQLIDKSYDYFGGVNNSTGRNYDPRDIFSWARIARDTNESKLEGLQNLEAMIENLKRQKEKNNMRKKEESNYDIKFENDKVIVVQPHSEGASCRLGRGTKWCTASTKGSNMFNNYTKDQGVKLYYVITKTKDDIAVARGWNDKWAIAEYPGGVKEYFDAEDMSIPEEQFFDEVLKPLGINPWKFLIKHDPVDAVIEMAANIETMYERNTHVIDIRQNEEDLLRMISELNKSQVSQFQRIRSDTNLPDKALLMAGAEVITKNAFEFFTNTRFNPPGQDVGPLIKRSNRDFQFIIIDMLDNWLTLSRAVDRDLDGLEKERKDNLTISINRMGDGKYGGGDNSHRIKLYSKNWIDSNWRDLHDIMLEILIERPHELKGECEAALRSLLGLCIDEKGGRWKELENHVIEDIKHVTTRLLKKSSPHPGDKNLDDYFLHLGQLGWPFLGSVYNRLTFTLDEFDQKENITQPLLPVEAEHFLNLGKYPIS